MEKQELPTHWVASFRLQNFMGFEDTDWIDLKPITLLFGRNSTGKSALIRALRLFKQSLNSLQGSEPFVLSHENGVDLGSIRDFIHNHDISLPLSFWFKVYLSEKFTDYFKIDKLQTPGDFKIKNSFVILNVTYIWDFKVNKIQLSEFQIMDGEPETSSYPVLSMKRVSDTRNDHHYTEPETGEVWEVISDYVDLDTHDRSSLWRGVKPVLSEGFLFNLDRPGYSISKGAYSEYYGEEVAKGFAFVEELIDYLKEQISDFLKSFVYIGPLREEPKRFYYGPTGGSVNIGNRGQYAIGSFIARQSEEGGSIYIDRINKWFRESSLGIQLEVERISEVQPLYQVTTVETNDLGKRFVSNVLDVGFGVSQLLPILIEAFFTGDKRLVIIEQPELHLHPKAQAELADLFIFMSQQGVRFLLETHSESLLMRFRRRIAETTANLSDSETLNITNENFQAYFVDRHSKEGSTIEALSFDRWGDYTYRPARFGDFFGQDFEELAKMKKARLGGGQ